MKKELRIAGIINESIVDGPGIRMVVFAQGCNHKCKGCHNPETHSFEGGTLMSIDEIIEKAKKNPLLDGITFSGGEPFEQAEAFSILADEARKHGLNIMTYTGYTYDFLRRNAAERSGWVKLLEKTDILVDGRFDIEKKNSLLKFRGSTNQRLIDMKRTIRNNTVVAAEI